jgi:hypothetical protein
MTHSIWLLVFAMTLPNRYLDILVMDLCVITTTTGARRKSSAWYVLWFRGSCLMTWHVTLTCLLCFALLQTSLLPLSCISHNKYKLKHYYAILAAMTPTAKSVAAAMEAIEEAPSPGSLSHGSLHLHSSLQLASLSHTQYTSLIYKWFRPFGDSCILIIMI